MGLVSFTGLCLGLIFNTYWLILPMIISLGLINAGFTGLCGLGIFISRIPWNKIL
jgi:hypothetical protein